MNQLHTVANQTAVQTVARSMTTYLKTSDLGRACVYKRIADVETLVRAYEIIKSRPGSMTPGTDRETLDGYSYDKLLKLSESLLNESYTCKPVRRVYIPKANGKMRPLGIPTIKDRIVQQSAKLVIEEIFERKFLDSSHGYRPRRSCHSALAQMNS